MLTTVRRGRFAAPIVCAAMLVATPTTEAASVSAPQRISPTGRIVTDSAVASGGGRTVILMASTTPHLRGAALDARLPTSGGSPILQRLATERAVTLRVGVGTDGTATAAWVSTTSSTSTLRVATAPPGHRFGASRVLATAAGVERAILLGGVAVTPDGRSIVTWRPNLSPQGTVVNSGTPVLAAIASVGGGFGAPQTLGSSLYDPPGIGVAPNGTVVVAWSHVPDAPLPPPAVNVPGRFVTYAATLPAGGATFGAPTEIGAPTGTWAASLGVDGSAGGLAVSWRETGTTRRVAAFNPDGTFAAGAALPAAGRSSISERVSVAPLVGGTRDALWISARTTSAGSGQPRVAGVVASRQAPVGSFSPGQRISSAGWDAGPPTATALADRTVAAWGEAHDGRGRVVVAARRVGGSWSTRARIAAPDLRTFDVHAAAGTNSVTVIWVQHVGPRSQSGGIAYRATYRP